MKSLDKARAFLYFSEVIAMSQASASAYALESLDSGLEGATLGRAEREGRTQLSARNEA